MSILKELYEQVKDVEVGFVLSKELNAVKAAFNRIKSRMTDGDGKKWDQTIGAVDKHIEDHDVGRTRAYIRKLWTILANYDIHEDCDVVYVDDDDNSLTEAAIMAFRRQGTDIKRKFRCTSGEKKGRLVSDPSTCTRRKNPKRMMAGRRISRAVKGIRIRKSKIALRRNTSKMVRSMNKRLKHGGVRKPKTVKKAA